MKKAFTILIADRNRHVLEFLRRELEKEFYRVVLAKSGQEVLKRISHKEPFDLLIMDPDLPDVDESFPWRKLQELAPTLPVVVHTFLSDYGSSPVVLDTAIFVEKGGKSIERLKSVVAEVLRKPHSQQIQAWKNNKIYSSES